MLSAVNLTGDTCSIQIASLGSDLCQRGGTLALPLQNLVSHGAENEESESFVVRNENRYNGGVAFRPGSVSCLVEGRRS